jgi:hypothetical protein
VNAEGSNGTTFGQGYPLWKGLFPFPTFRPFGAYRATLVGDELTFRGLWRSRVVYIEDIRAIKVSGNDTDGWRCRFYLHRGSAGLSGPPGQLLAIRLRELKPAIEISTQFRYWGRYTACDQCGKPWIIAGRCVTCWYRERRAR